ncbi:hypothetical protein AMECASPLE_039289 [Ameca splendens]|uniref:SAM domain-containing protein n=1 Tax=Ameca splendens TaxID=208324 RepID=A0ABV0XXA8_9TELE
MSQSGTENWTTEDVHHWLMMEVKVSQSCADRFIKEEVLGEYLVSFKKTDILDLGIRHGPAVKIMCFLKSLTEASEHRSEYPAYVEAWTKEQVSQWLLQHVKIYPKYARRLLDEDVSGDCLVCFRKQDLLDLNVKSGPAVKILAELEKLNNRPEPTLQPITDQREGDECVEPENNMLHTLANEQNLKRKTESQDTSVRASIKAEEEPTEPEPVGAMHKTSEVKFQTFYHVSHI